MRLARARLPVEQDRGVEALDDAAHELADAGLLPDVLLRALLAHDRVEVEEQVPRVATEPPPLAHLAGRQSWKAWGWIQDFLVWKSRPAIARRLVLHKRSSVFFHKNPLFSPKCQISSADFSKFQLNSAKFRTSQ